MTGKQRAFLRSMANTIDAKYQIGKNGIEDNLLKTLSDALEANEIIKVHVLETSMLDTREACTIICDEIKAEPVQCIGSKFVIYRESKNKKKIELPKKNKK